jgi:hypothetical protein
LKPDCHSTGFGEMIELIYNVSCDGLGVVTNNASEAIRKVIDCSTDLESVRESKKREGKGK